MKARIKTTGELRQFVADMMLAVKNGEAKPETASAINKLAGQINESFYSEIKMARLRIDAGQKMDEMGALLIGSSSAAE